MERAYEDDKTLALAKSHGFFTVAPPQKNRKFPWFYDKKLYKQRNNRKIFTRYDKLDSIFIYTISLTFIFDLLFM